MDESDTATYAKGIAAALRIMGPKPRDAVLRMIAALRLTQAEASEVVAYALAHGLLVDDGANLSAVAER